MAYSYNAQLDSANNLYVRFYEAPGCMRWVHSKPITQQQEDDPPKKL